MRNRLPWLLLTLSLALNVFVVAGVLYSGNIMGGDQTSPEQRLETVVERLGLSDAQRDQLIAIRERTIARRDEMRAGGGRMREVFVAALEAESYDRTAFITRMGERNALRLDFFADTIADLHGFLAGLRPEQKATFLELVQERRFLRQLLGRKQRDRR